MVDFHKFYKQIKYFPEFVGYLSLDQADKELELNKDLRKLFLSVCTPEAREPAACILRQCNQSK